MADNSLNGSLTWIKGLQFVAHATGSGAAIVMDGKAAHGGFESGVSPMEALLLSLAGCTGMDVISVLLKKRQAVTDFRVDVEGIRADEHPRRYVRIELSYIVAGEDVSAVAVERAIELSLGKYCGVTASLNAEIVQRYEIHPSGTES